MTNIDITDTVFPIPNEGVYEQGLTKREYFAGLALQGLLVNAERNSLSFLNAHKEAVRQADLLLEELDKTK